MLSFEFKDGRNESPVAVDQSGLLKVLSGGERRALYLLNVLFEVEARRRSGKFTLFVVDDIADSFDYRNKYAILQYLKDMADTDSFRIIALTHNFDFFRAFSLRLRSQLANRFIAERNQSNVEIREAEHTESPFSDWRKTLHTECSVSELIATIPFVRTLLEYTGNDNDFDSLTETLHLKEHSKILDWSVVLNIYKKELKNITTFACVDLSSLIIDTIYTTAIKLESENKTTYSLSEKIVLAIATRLMLEEAIQKRLNALDDKTKKKNNVKLYYKLNQTSRLCNAYIHNFPADKVFKSAIDTVQIITPEHLHINSFMYEPLIDLSGESLLKILKEVKALNA